MAKPQQSTAVTTAAQTLPAALADHDLESMAGQGLEQAGANSFAIPFLRILQSNSPQVKRTEGAYIEGAVEGMMLNTVTNGVIDPAKVPLDIVPVFYRQAYVEWKLTEDGGGFVAEHPPTTPLAGQTKRDDKNRDILPNGHQLVDTRYHYVLAIRKDSGESFPALITMASTQIKHSKRWMSVIAGNKQPRKSGVGFYNPPSFSYTYALGVQVESNEKNSWWGWKIGEPQLISSATLFMEAKDFYTKLQRGEVKEAQPDAPPVGDAQSSGANADRAAF